MAHHVLTAEEIRPGDLLPLAAIEDLQWDVEVPRGGPAIVDENGAVEVWSVATVRTFDDVYTCIHAAELAPIMARPHTRTIVVRKNS